MCKSVLVAKQLEEEHFHVGSQELVKDWSDFFKNLDEENCPLTCSVKEGPKCSKEYTGENIRLSIGNEVIARNGIATGYDEVVCL